jgi:hypothetical protein
LGVLDTLTRRLLPVVLALTLVVSACGGRSGPAAAHSPHVAQPEGRALSDRFVAEVAPVESSAAGFVTTVASGTSWANVSSAARPYVRALRTFDGELISSGFAGRAAVQARLLAKVDNMLIDDLADATALAPPANWQNEVQAQAQALDSLEADLGLAAGGATLRPTVSSWFAGHAALVALFANDFKQLGVAVAATAHSAEPPELAALHRACAALRASALEDADIPVPSASLQHKWATALATIAKGALNCLDGISGVSTGLLEGGIVRLAQGKALLGAFLTAKPTS